MSTTVLLLATTITVLLWSTGDGRALGRPVEEAPAPEEVQEVPAEEATSAPVEEAAVRQRVVAHLNKYAYLPTPKPTDEDLQRALRLFQSVAGVPITGVVDEDTVAATRRSRCSRPDTDEEPEAQPGSRRKRYALAKMSRWNPRHFTGPNRLRLKWHISKYTTDMPKPTVRSLVRKAFDLWSNQIELKNIQQLKLIFEETMSTADTDINIRWEQGRHNDTFPFDGKGGDTENVLAHTFFPDYNSTKIPDPNINGDIHFDDAEKWSNQVGVNTFFPYVLVHEIGHALGLQHSKNTEAIMNPHYKDIQIERIEFSADDKCGINWNYVGPSNWCLWVWLTSEVLPLHHVEVRPEERDHDLLTFRRRRESLDLSSASAFELLTNGTGALTAKQEKILGIRRQLKRAVLPQCKDTNTVRDDMELLLQKQLHFQADEARVYGALACRFLDGLNTYRNKVGKTSDTLEAEFGAIKEFAGAATDPTEVRHLFKRALRRREHARASVLDEHHFDTAFFDEFFAAY